MTREKFYDLMQLVHTMIYRVVHENPVSEARYLDAYRKFESGYVEPLEIAAAIQSALAKGPTDNPPMSGRKAGTLDDFQTVPDEQIEQDILPTAADVRGILKPEHDARTAPWVCMICRTARATGWLVMKIYASAAPKITCFRCAHGACWNDKLSGGYLSFDTINGLADDAELSAICDERAGMPSVQ